MYDDTAMTMVMIRKNPRRVVDVALRHTCIKRKVLSWTFNLTHPLMYEGSISYLRSQTINSRIISKNRRFGYIFVNRKVMIFSPDANGEFTTKGVFRCQNGSEPKRKYWHLLFRRVGTVAAEDTWTWHEVEYVLAIWKGKLNDLLSKMFILSNSDRRFWTFEFWTNL